MTCQDNIPVRKRFRAIYKRVLVLVLITPIQIRFPIYILENTCTKLDRVVDTVHEVSNSEFLSVHQVQN